MKNQMSQFEKKQKIMSKQIRDYIDCSYDLETFPAPVQMESLKEIELIVRRERQRIQLQHRDEIAQRAKDRIARDNWNYNRPSHAEIAQQVADRGVVS